MNTAKLGEKFSVASGIPFNILFPGNQAGLLSAVTKSLRLRVPSGCLNSGVPKGLDNPTVILLRLEPASAWLYAVLTAAAVGQSSDKSGDHSTLPFVPQPSRHGQTSHRQPPPAPAIAPARPGQRSSLRRTRVPYAARALCAHIAFSCKIPICPVTPQSWVWEKIVFTHSLSCAHGDSTLRYMRYCQSLLGISYLSFGSLLLLHTPSSTRGISDSLYRLTFFT